MRTVVPSGRLRHARYETAPATGRAVSVTSRAPSGSVLTWQASGRVGVRPGPVRLKLHHWLGSESPAGRIDRMKPPVMPAEVRVPPTSALVGKFGFTVCGT